MRFPTVTGSNLNQEQFTLPKDLEGELNLVFIAFTEWQQYVVDSWMPKARQLKQQFDGLHYYEIPTIYPMNLFQRWWLDNIMRAGITDEAVRAITITIYVDIPDFLAALDLPNNDTAYALLLDREGEVIWRAAGLYDEDKGDALRQAIVDARLPQPEDDARFNTYRLN
ncbi:MAG: hypothetical protein ACOCXZ_03255 [Chloroflexota bacterium]